MVMNVQDRGVLPEEMRYTYSVCPVCLKRIPAKREERDGQIYLVYNASNTTSGSRLCLRHDGRANVSYLSGHVSAVGLNEMRANNWNLGEHMPMGSVYVGRVRTNL